MKIRKKLTLRYVAVTAVVFSAVLVAVYLFSERAREQEFFRSLTAEAVTKANLFLDGRVDAQTMQSIYLNNREFINEVEVAIYTPEFQLLYHDAQDIDIIKETPELVGSALEKKEINFYEDDYQAVAMVYSWESTNYVVTAAAYDGFGYAKLERLAGLLLVLWISGLALLALVGYWLARGALRPVSRIVDEVDAITESNLEKRVAVINENDELGELTHTFNLMLDRLQRSFDNQKMFVGQVAHELRTPLAALMAELEISLLRQERTAEEYRTIITHALADGQRLKNLISGLLDLARAGYDAAQISFEELRLDELLLDARKTVLTAHSDYCVELVFDQDAEDERLLTVMGNEYLLKTAFINLIGNNCKFSENKTSHVHISFYGDSSLIRFSDTGIGIPAEEMGCIFTPFYRGGNAGSVSGQGIGLALVQKIVLVHRGEIAVNSHIGEGTVFTVRIPHILF